MDTEPVATPPNAAPLEAAQLAERRWQAVVRRDLQMDGEFVVPAIFARKKTGTEVPVNGVWPAPISSRSAFRG